MSLVVIDAGNTNIKIVRWDNVVPIPDFRSEGFAPGTATDQPTMLGSIPSTLLQHPSEFKTQVQGLNIPESSAHVFVSVVPAANEILQQIYPNIKRVCENGAFPYPHKIQNVETVGPDRFCNVATALAAGLNSALIVDAGTATTFDLLLDGIFEGGLIAPGMAFAARQLAIQGAMLEEVPFQHRPPTVGTNSSEAMMGGAWLTGCGGVQWTIERLLETYGPLNVILTGGLSNLLPRENRYFDPYWTLRGASFLARQV